MVLKHASLVHGTSLQLENNTWRTLRQGFYATVRPNDGNTGWVHFPVPTPVIVNNERLKVGSAMLRCTTGPGAIIDAVHVYDGERKIVDSNGLNLTPRAGMERFMVPGTPQVFWGTVVCVHVRFIGSYADNYVQFISAGIDFVN